MKTIIFQGHKTQISEQELSNDRFNVDFDGHLLVSFCRDGNNKIIAINAMNGYGENIQSQVWGQSPEIA